MSSNIIYKDREVKKFIFKLINHNTSLNSRVEKEVDVIFKNIKKNGDKALFNYAKRFKIK